MLYDKADAALVPLQDTSEVHVCVLALTRMELGEHRGAEASQSRVLHAKHVRVRSCHLVADTHARCTLIRTNVARPSLLVVDEAGQAPEAETLIALQLRPQACLLVGDPQQASHAPELC